MEFKDKLREVRLAIGMTQEELAGRSNLHPSAISHFEGGTRAPSLKNLVRLCKGLRCKPNDLVDTHAK